MDEFGIRARQAPSLALPELCRQSKLMILSVDQGYLDRAPLYVAAVELAGIRTLVAVPMLKENELVGVIIIYRKEVRPFTDKQVELVTEFRPSGRDRYREYAAA